MYSGSQAIYFLIFFCLLFLLLIFGETTLGIPLFGLLALLELFFIREVKFERVSQFILPIYLFGALVGITFLSLLTTISIPLTVNAAIFYALSYLVFVFTLLRNPRWLTTSAMAIGVSTLAVCLGALTFLYTAVPQLSSYLPSTTLLTAMYGHNQAAVLFLLALPLLWWTAEEKKSWLARLGIVFVFGSLLLTFARLGIVLGVTEVGVLWFTTADKKLKKLGAGLLFLSFGVLLAVSLAWSLVMTTSGDCPYPVFQAQLCKPLHQELRPEYWRQALQALIQRPLTGWGGGTFSLVSLRLQSREGLYSGYAHNELLQAFTEYGLLGGLLFLVFFFWIIRKGLYQLRFPHQRLSFCFALAVLAVILESFFNFSLHLIGLWLLFLIVTACWISEVKQESSLGAFVRRFRTWITRKHTQFFLPASGMGVKVYFATLAVGTLLWAGLYLTSVFFWQKKQYDTALSLFPFAYWRVENSLSQPELISTSTQNFLFTLYGHHPRIWDSAAQAANIPSTQKAKYLQTAIPLDPHNQLRYFQYVDAALKGEDNDLAEQALTTWIERSNRNLLDNYSYPENGVIAALGIEKANQLLDKNPIQALHFYELSYTLQPEQFLYPSLPVLEQIAQLPISETLPLLNILDTDFVFRYARPLYAGESLQLQQALAQGQPEIAEQLMNNILRMGEYDWEVAELILTSWQESSSTTKQEAQVLIAYSKVILAWEEKMGPEYAFNYKLKGPLAEQLSRQAQLYQERDPQSAMELSQYATQIGGTAVDRDQ